MANSKDTRFTLMAFPQLVKEDGTLTVNFLFIPRNINPLLPVNTIFGDAGQAAPFATAQLVFNIVVVNNPDEFPGKIAADERADWANIVYSDQIADIYKTLRDARDEEGRPKYFDIDETYSSDNAAQPEEQKAPVAEERSTAIKKYLPVSYRKAFNFTSPRLPNAVTDDSYHCAMRDQQQPASIPKSNKISWGKVYAHLLRQPLMAEKAGLLYKTQITLAPDDFKRGGWLYIDIAAGSLYAAEQAKSIALASDFFVKRYAARIPSLKKAADGKFLARALFASVLFPVVNAGDSPDGAYDDLYIEAADYNNGLIKIIHANQPVSANLLAESQDGFHPQKEAGIRLGWDDEQILTWYLRQLAKDDSVAAGAGRLDAPLGIAGYHIDVKDAEISGAEWESLNAVTSNGNMMLENINIGSYAGELPFQVYPVKLFGVATSNYWLPMYFANWNDCSLVIPDKTAAEIYLNAQALQMVEGVTENRNVKVSDTYTANVNVKLKYGHAYDFKVRLADLTGGSPAIAGEPTGNRPGSVASLRFKRYVAPFALRIVNEADIKTSTDDLNFNGNMLVLKRPLMGYPSVVYTGKYTDAIGLLKASVAAQLTIVNEDNKAKVQIGLADPDVVAVMIKVEVETLQMDNLASDDGKQNYITLYSCRRKFADDYESDLSISLNYKDYQVLNLTAINHPFGNANDDATIIADSGEIILPTCRNIRITLRAVADGSDDYWGSSSTDPDLDSRYGKPTVLKLRKDSVQEPQLFAGLDDARLLQGIYLQPDPQPEYTGKITVKQTVPISEGLPDILHRFAKQLDVACNGLTLAANKGERVQFWCSNLLRHSLAPDNSSITFAGKNELTHHWLVVISLTVNRDWSWDGLNTLSFEIERRKSTEDNPFDVHERKTKADNLTYNLIGTMELRRIAPFQAIQAGDDGFIHREYTKVVLIDVIDSLPAPGKFPDTILAQYKITPRFIDGVVPDVEFFETKDILLPATINPTQLPKVIGAGIALSPYVRNDKYSSTDARKRFLWLEMDAAPEDNRDEIFARHLSYSPDQLISNNHPLLYEPPAEPPIPLDPEHVRVITPDSGHDHFGLKAMQKMEKSVDAGRQFYLLPLPEGMHSESAELFGFHTYEFRYGHTEKLWSTAQGRFGRAFRLTGLQHPAPNLLCTVNRDDIKISVSAPYAMAVYNGQNVTANPPKTAIWSLLYAQVSQADGLGYRNILIAERKLEYVPESRDSFKKKIEMHVDFNGKPWSPQVQLQFMQQKYNLNVAIDRDAPKYAQTEWTNKEIEQQLALYGLPIDSPLSVVSVEVFGHTRNIAEHISDFENVKEHVIAGVRLNMDEVAADYMQQNLTKPVEAQPDESMPLSSQLGLYRILRTSPLTEVPFICCTK
ncbi:hypothetical protein A0256_15400 [Mucilaginibacter sp. PAMC 26640]|nr:hypothetical protein A0256_15400 [Mucilaginibacter sp. PAMC 26640]